MDSEDEGKSSVLCSNSHLGKRDISRNTIARVIGLEAYQEEFDQADRTRPKFQPAIPAVSSTASLKMLSSGA